MNAVSNNLMSAFDPKQTLKNVNKIDFKVGFMIFCPEYAQIAIMAKSKKMLKLAL